MNSRIQKAIFGILFTLDKKIGISQIARNYQTAKLRRLLRKSHTGLRIQHPVVIEHPEKVSIGKGGSISAYLHIWGGGGVEIGDRVLIGSHVVITSETHDHHHHPMTETFVKKPIHIEDDVWLGAHAIILPGIRIGRGAVVAAGAVVTKNVESGMIVAGVPARVIGKRTAH